MSPTSIGRIIKETTGAIWDVLLEKGFLQPPQSSKDWESISRGFENRWNFPHCVGALDGKHVVIQAPAKSGSLFFNYKKNFSIVLLALCDASYQFTVVDIGEAGKQSDGGVFANSNLGRSMVNASRIIENIFGILAARFRTFHRPILSCLEMIENITNACAVLQKYLTTSNNFGETNSYCPNRFIDQDVRRNRDGGKL